MLHAHSIARIGFSSNMESLNGGLLEAPFQYGLAEAFVHPGLTALSSRRAERTVGGFLAGLRRVVHYEIPACCCTKSNGLTNTSVWR